MSSGQRAVPVKKRGLFPFSARTLAVAACALVLLSSGIARAQDGGIPDIPVADDAPKKPKIVEYANGVRCMNEPAWLTIDNEVSRLQKVEEKHKGEIWTGVLLTGALVGLLVGVAAGTAVGVAIGRANAPK